MERMKQKYVYVIVGKSSGKIILESGRLPMYWTRKVAKKEQERIGIGEVRKMLLETLEKIIY